MTINFSTAGDFATVADGLQTITLLRRESPAGPGEVVAHALHRAIDTSEVVGENKRTIDSDGRYTAADVVWSLPAAELSAPPRSGDVIQDSADRRWTIVETRLVALADRWHCSTRELAIAEGLEDEIDILVNTSGDWTVLQENIPGRIQPLETVIKDGATPSSVRSYRIILAQPFDLDHTHRLRGPDDTLYRPTKAAGFPKLGQYQIVEAEKIA
jgi:hypothetical protein